MDETLRILLVENNLRDVRLVQHCVGRTTLMECYLKTVARLHDAVDLLRRQPFDVVILDADLPDMSAAEALQQLRATGVEVPVIVLISRSEPRLAVETMKAGAEDCLAKDELLTMALPRAIRSIHERAGLLRRIRRGEQEVAAFAETLRQRNRELAVVAAIAGLGQFRASAKEYVNHCLQILDQSLEIEESCLLLREDHSLTLAAERNLSEAHHRGLAAHGAELRRLVEEAATAGSHACWQMPGEERAMLLFPLTGLGGRPFGALGVLPGRRVAELRDTDITLLRTASQQVALFLENTEHVRQLREQARFRAELDLARQVQANLLPKWDLHVGSLSAAGRVRQADVVGGDFFDLIRLGEGRMAVVIADASGKGFPAAIVIAMVAACVDSLTAVDAEPDRVLVALNRMICSRVGSSRFVTAFYAVWDESAGSLTACNAGHVPPLWIHARDGEVDRPAQSGPALGFVEDAAPHLQSYTLPLAPGDCLCLLSDGLTGLIQMQAAGGFDEAEICRLLRAHADKPLPVAVEALDRGIGEILRTSPQVDDIAWVVLRRD